jgi:neuropeptide Y receptor type 1
MKGSDELAISNFSENWTLYYMNMSIPNNEMPLDIILYGTIFYILIFIIGVTGNLLVIFVLLKDRELRNFTNFLLANLSVADLMVLFACVPSALHDLFAKEKWYLGKMLVM